MATNENNPCTCTTPEYTIILNQQGPSGRQGATGQNGFSPIISVDTNTRDTYKLSITTADGVITTPNLKSEPIPSGGSNGQVLTNFGNDIYGWGSLPYSSTNSAGVVTLATISDFSPDTYGDINDTKACTPQTVVDYVNSVGLPVASTTTLGGIKVGDGLSITEDGVLSTSGGGSTNLNNITDTNSGVAITNADSGLIYPETINIVTATEDENYSYIECKSSGSSLSSGIKFNLNKLTLMGGILDNTNVDTAGFRLNFDTSMIIGEPVFLKGRGDSTVGGVSNLTALDYTHTIQDSGALKSNGFFIFDKQTSYVGSFTTKGILFTAGDEPSIKFTTSTANNGVWTDNINATVLTDKSGIQYQALTQSEYDGLETKSENTMYRLTDTNEVYLGSIKLTGGGNITPATYAGIPAGGQNTGYVGNQTVTTYNPTT